MFRAAASHPPPVSPMDGEAANPPTEGDGCSRVGVEKPSFIMPRSPVLPERRRFVSNICRLDSAGSWRRANAPLIALEASVSFVRRLFHQQVSNILLQTGLLLASVSLRARLWLPQVTPAGAPALAAERWIKGLVYEKVLELQAALPGFPGS